MKNKIFKLKNIIIGLVLILLLVLTALVFSMTHIISSNATEYAPSTERNLYSTRYYITVNDTVTVVDSRDYFLYNADSDTVIEVVFELSDLDLAPVNQADFLPMTATAQEIEAAMAIYTEQMRQFHTARNLAFLREHNFSLQSYYHRVTISYFSPHILKAFENIYAFEYFSEKIESAQQSTSAQRVSVMQAMDLEKLSAHQDHIHAPHYTMEQVRRDIGITNNNFMGVGVNVGIMEFAHITRNYAELSHLVMETGGINSTEPFDIRHANNVVRTLAGSLGIAPHINRLRSFTVRPALQGFLRQNFLDAFNWFILWGNTHIVNLSIGSYSVQYDWFAAYLDWVSRHHNITFVAASGNVRLTGQRHVASPAIGFNVIAVGSSNANGYVSSYSLFDVPPGLNARGTTLVAPGTWLQTTLPGPPHYRTHDGICRINYGEPGTSFAAPIVAGVVARLMQEFPILRARPDMVKAALIASATPVNGQPIGVWCERAGAGRVHYERARQAVRNAISWQSSTCQSALRVASQFLNVPSGSRLRIVAFWQANSVTNNNNRNTQILPNIHTRYRLHMRHSQHFSNHNSNIQILWHNTHGIASASFVDLYQVGFRNSSNTIADRGVITWVEESSTATCGLLIRDGIVTEFIQQPNFDGRISIPNGITAIGEYAFEYQSGIKSVNIPNTVTDIGNHAFIGTGLTSLFIPPSVVRLGGGAFAHTPNLTTVTGGSNLAYIERWAFHWSGLEQFTLPSRLVYIGYQAFSRSQLSSAIIPASLRVLGDFAFAHTASLSSVTIMQGLPRIGIHSFYRSALGDIFLPDSITSIGGGAFAHTYELRHMTMGTGLQRIEQWAFRGSRIERVTFTGNALNYIGYNAFSLSWLNEIRIPASVNTIGANAFRDARLTRMVMLRAVSNVSQVPALGANAISNTPIARGEAGAYIFVPNAASLAAYQSAANWHIYAARIRV